MESRLGMTEEGTAMQALLGADSNGDTPWRLNVDSFRLPGHHHPESSKTAAADCMQNAKFVMQNFSTFLVLVLFLACFSGDVMKSFQLQPLFTKLSQIHIA